jgi:uncharacterized protein YjbJ (UPF0337 family)
MSGKTDVVKGRIEEAAGALTGNDKLCAEGKTDQAISEGKQGAKKAVDKVEQVSPPMPHGKPARGNDKPCAEGKTHQAIGKSKQGAEKAVDKVGENGEKSKRVKKYPRANGKGHS